MERLPVTLLESVCDIVRQAAAFMMRDDFSVEQKDSVVNVVTTADKQVQNFLENRLPDFLPESAVFGEEDPASAKDAEYLWIVDPIDGTMNFTRQLGESAISVGLFHNGSPLLGVVFNPFRNEMFYAKKGEGAWLNGRRIGVSKATFAEGLFCTAWSLYNKALAPQCKAIMEETYAACNDFRRFGSAALELCYLAAGRCDLYFEIRVFPWDWTAGGLILTEAGGVITGLDDCLPPYDRATPLIAANNRANYMQLREIVTKHIPEVPYEEIFL